jgi:hypothetical protein
MEGTVRVVAASGLQVRQLQVVDGVFRLRGLTPGPYVALFEDGTVPQSFVYPAGQEEVVLTEGDLTPVTATPEVLPVAEGAAVESPVSSEPASSVSEPASSPSAGGSVSEAVPVAPVTSEPSSLPATPPTTESSVAEAPVSEVTWPGETTPPVSSPDASPSTTTEPAAG